jgi:hypothetical protein
MLAPPPPIVTDLMPGIPSASEGGGLATFVNRTKDRITLRNMIYAGSISIALMGTALVLLYLLNRYNNNLNRRELRRLETPPAIASRTFLTQTPVKNLESEYTAVGLDPSLETMAASIPQVSTSPLFQARPYCPSKPDDYFGVITISSRKSATLTINLTAETHGYSEVVVYNYPEWTIVYSETGLSELPFDFLPDGTYTAIVYATAPVEGVLETCRNRKRSAPVKRVHRTTNQLVSDMRNASADSVVSALAPSGTSLVDTVQAEPVFVWPGTVFTRVETLSAVVSPDTAAIYIALPAYGFVVEGANEHLGPLIHEGNCTAIYRAVLSPQKMSSTVNQIENRIHLTVVYPNIDPTFSHNASPNTTLYVFGHNNSPQFSRVETSSHTDSE